MSNKIPNSITSILTTKKHNCTLLCCHLFLLTHMAVYSLLGFQDGVNLPHITVALCITNFVIKAQTHFLLLYCGAHEALCSLSWKVPSRELKLLPEIMEKYSGLEKYSSSRHSTLVLKCNAKRIQSYCSLWSAGLLKAFIYPSRMSHSRFACKHQES